MRLMKIRLRFRGAGSDSADAPRAGVAETSRPGGPDDSRHLRHNLSISIWVRWFVIITWVAQFNYRVNLEDPNYLPTMLFAMAVLALNGYVHYRILTNRPVTWRWMLALSVMDMTMITAGIAISTRFQNTYFVLYYPALAMFAVTFTSFRLNLAWTTMAAIIYAAMSLSLAPGVDFDTKEEKVLFTRIAVMFAVVAAVNLISRFERIRRLAAVERERELQRERVDLSQTMHDTVAQAAYMIGLGLETAIELASGKNGKDRDNRKEVVAKLEAIHSLSRTTMWELRHPIDARRIFEGRELGPALMSYASTFGTITSIPARVVQSGEEPMLSIATRRRLFSIVHNALTNAFRHSRAGEVIIGLDFEKTGLRLSVSDDGVGLPSDYAQRGHGLRNMREEAERMGGNLEAGPGDNGRGVRVTCSVPYQGNLEEA